MIVVIIAGGSGSRLWPLSTPDYPKHLLSIDGSDESLLQATYKRARQLADDIYIVSDSSHINHVKEQLPDLPEEAFIVEPARRGTAGCILAALSRVSKRHDAGEPVAFMHADHYIRDTEGFLHSLRLAGEASDANGRMVLIGIEPDYPATGFGYIQKGKLFDEQRFIFNVHSFKEKPDHGTALKYLNSGHYLWNGGYFVGSLNTFLKEMKAVAPDLLARYEKLNSASPEAYESVYLGFENIAIDYALIEKVPDLLVLPATFDWMDLGSFSDLSKAVGGDDQGNHLRGEKVIAEEVNNSLVHNGEQKPVIVIGVDDLVVINTPQGLLVTKKEMSQKVGEASKRLLDSD